MNKEKNKKLKSSLACKLYELDNQDKSKKINRIRLEFMEQISKLKEERDMVIKEAVFLLEERKIKELEGKL